MAKEQLIGLEVSGLEELVPGLKRMAQEHKDAAGDEIAKYLKNVLQAYPPKKQVTRLQAYGVTFFTAKQRRYFFWALNSGRITVPYRRTQKFRNQWRILGSGLDTIIVNDSDYGEHLMDDNNQSRHAAAIGWKKIKDVIKEKENQIDRRMTAAGEKAMKRSGFKT